MRQFFKFFIASIFGSAVGIFLAFLMMFLVLGSISAGLMSKAKNNKVDVKPNSALFISLDYPLKERSSNNPFEGFDFGSFQPKMSLGLNDVLKSIDKAKNDDNIKGIYLNMSFLPSGLATVEAVRKALIDFKTSGKFIVAYGEIITQKAYYLASVADEIYANPVGYMDFGGFASELAFLKGTLEKLEIEPQIIYAGKYKSATEPFRLDKMSDENREQVSSIINNVFTDYLSGIAEARGLTVALLDSVSYNMVIRDIKDGVKVGLLDDVLYYDQVRDILKEKVGLEEGDDLEMISLEKYSNKDGAKFDFEKLEHKDSGKDKIAVLYAQGGIVDGKGEEDNIGSARYASEIRKIREDESVKALVFRINSGGGSALASDVILREIKLTKEKMPVIVSMGDVAASGGYYIACEADTIIAEPNTITGSIGVFGMMLNMKDMFNNKLGVTFDGVKTGKFSDMGTVSRPLTVEEREIIQVAIDSIYMVFKQRVAAGRGMTVLEVDEIAQGRVWTGNQAKEIGLVDVLGGMDEAIEIAVAKAGVEDYELADYPERKDPFQKFFEELNLEASAFLLKRKLGEHYSLWKRMEEINEMRGIQAAMPYDLVIH